jgi:hypothetical protein
VRLNKTKIMIFSKKMTEKNLFYFYYGPNAVEPVNSYKYLGVMFYFTGKFSKFGLKSVIYTPDPYVKMGAIIELYNFSQDFSDKLLL